MNKKKISSQKYNIKKRKQKVSITKIKQKRVNIFKNDCKNINHNV